MFIGTARNCTLLSCGHRSFEACNTARVSCHLQPYRRKAFSRRADISLAATPTPETSEQADVEYVDTWTDVQFINMCRRAYGGLAGWQSPRSWKDGPETYQAMLEVSRALMKGKSAGEQRDAVIKGFPKIPGWFRRVFPYSKWGAELNARITPAFFTWLVGPMQTEEVDVDGVMQKSSVHIKRCRYLAESGCVGMCVNLCKTPTQTFFTEELGMPLTMKPNFDDYSCDMIFGQRPPNLTEDEVNLQACYADCPQAKAGTAKCHKLA